MDRDVRARLKWVRLWQEVGNAGLVCQRCGISRPTLRKWVTRYLQSGLDGLRARSKRPKRSPQRKVTREEEKQIVELRLKRKLGARRIQSGLQRLYDYRLSLATIHKTLKRLNVPALKRARRKKNYRRYSRPIPGDRVQMDTCKVGPGKYQYTAVDDCTRCRVLGLFPRRSGENTIEFIDQVIEEMPFPIQRFQTDRGREFFAVPVQRHLMGLKIKFRPIKPGSPHLNGKVERSQKTDFDEFYSTTDLSDAELELRLAEWQHYYNWQRPHGSLGGKSPMDRFFELIHETPYWEEVHRSYDSRKEQIQEADYRLELRLRELKRSL